MKYMCPDCESTVTIKDFDLQHGGFICPNCNEMVAIQKDKIIKD